jgi:DNA-binding FadR family transcriptional regulator
MTKVGGGSAVATVAQAIREDIFRMADGEFIGSEESLIERYGVSRPTLRQAAGLLLQEQLLTARRGVRGGFFARRPDSAAVTHMMALYLRSREVKVRQLIETMLPIRTEIARLAARSRNKPVRTALATFLKAESAMTEPFRFDAFIEAERQFNLLLAKLSGNTTLSLFLEVMLDLSAMVHKEGDVYRADPQRMIAYREARNGLAAAVLNEDGELAMVFARRCAEMTHRWVCEISDPDNMIMGARPN